MLITEMPDAAFIFGVLGAASSQVMNLSALPSITEILRSKSTLLYPAFPFIIGLAASWTGLAYCIITGQTLVIISTSCTMSFNLTFLTIHFIFSKNRRELIRLFSLVGSAVIMLSTVGPLIFCLSRTKDACEEFTKDWLGVVIVLVYGLLYCGQLWTLRTVIKTRNSASISPWLTAGLAFCALMWTLYSIFVPDYFYLGSSVTGDISALIQIFLLIKYPRILNAVEAPASNP